MSEAVSSQVLSGRAEESKLEDADMEAINAGSSKITEDSTADLYKSSSNGKSSDAADGEDEETRKRAACAQSKWLGRSRNSK